LGGRIRYVDVPRVIAESLAALPAVPVIDLATALAVDIQARTEADGQVDRISPRAG
jgi:hypothetical protein